VTPCQLLAAAQLVDHEGRKCFALIHVAPAVPRVFAFPMQAEQSIIVDPKSPGGINSPHGLILFDGVSVLCLARLPLREQT
jgi:hypothetical protein